MNAPSRLRCEYLLDPIGLDVAEPRFSWRMNSTARGARQTARQIQVATDPTALAEDVGAAWDTGKVVDDVSIQVVYAGEALRPRQRYWWRVRIWDQEGAVSPWSDSAWWETGLLSEKPWDAEWISVDERTGDAGQPSPFLRRSFECRAAPSRARLYVTALGDYECHVNGQRVGDDWFTPGFTDYAVRVPYQTHDVTSMLREGENAIGAIVADGWACGELVWPDNRSLWSKQPFLKAMLICEYEDGSVDAIHTDDSWRVTTGPILEAEHYHGETYDTRLEMPGWDAPGFDDSSWSPAWVGPPNDAAMSAKPGPNVKVIRELPAQAVFEPKPGVYVIDMGQNMAGRVRLRVKAPAGTTITMRHAEMLHDDGTIYTANLGSACATDRYVCRGDGEEIYEPRFTYHGFRYVELTGCADPPQPADVTGVVMHSDMALTTQFQCSSDLVNKLQRCIEWSHRANFFDVPTDCPQRSERMGWTGDAQVFAPTACYSMDVAAFYTKWCVDVEDGGDADGAFPSMAPDVATRTGRTGWHGAAAWSDAVVVCPWTIYRFYGDVRILERHYDAMSAWVDYMERTSADLIRPEEDGYGDHLNPEQEVPNFGPTSRALIGTAYFIRCADLMQQIASLLGRDEDARRFADLAKRIRRAFLHEFVTPAGRLAGRGQTDYVLAFCFDLLPDAMHNAAIGYLMQMLEESEWHLRTGFIGTPILNNALTLIGRTDAAYRLLLQETRPSWLYMVKRGATTIWEKWDLHTEENGFSEPRVQSFNHFGFGAVGEWLYSVVGGIALDPDVPAFKRFRIQPEPGEGIDSADMTMDSMHGPIRCRWRKTPDVFTVEATIPANTSAAVILPCGDQDRVIVNDTAADQAHGVSDVRVHDGHIMFDAVAGEYTIEIRTAGS